jgi:biopolymer transport protein ExbD
MRRRRRRVEFAMDITPVNLIDLVLILLIFFITTTTFLNLKLIDLVLPEADGAAVQSEQKPLVLSIDSGGALFADKKPLLFEQLPRLLKSRHAADPKLEVLIAADAGSRHEAFVRAVAAVKNEKIGQIGIVTDLSNP